MKIGGDLLDVHVADGRLIEPASDGARHAVDKVQLLGDGGGHQRRLHLQALGGSLVVLLQMLPGLSDVQGDTRPQEENHQDQRVTKPGGLFVLTFDLLPE